VSYDSLAYVGGGRSDVNVIPVNRLVLYHDGSSGGLNP